MQIKRKRLLMAAVLLMSCLLVVPAAPGGEFDAYSSWKKAQKEIKKCDKQQKGLEKELRTLRVDIERLEKSKDYSRKRWERLEDEKKTAKQENETGEEYLGLLFDVELAKNTYNIEKEKLDDLKEINFVKLNRRITDVRKKCTRVRLLARLGEEQRTAQAMEAIQNELFSHAETIIKRMSPTNSAAFVQLLKNAVANLEKEFNLAMKECRFIRPHGKGPRPSILIDQLPQGPTKRNELKKKLEKAVNREAGVLELYREAKKLWKKAKKQYKFGNNEKARALSEKSLKLLQRAWGDSHCNKYKDPIRKVIFKMKVRLFLRGYTLSPSSVPSLPSTSNQGPPVAGGTGITCKADGKLKRVKVGPKKGKPEEYRSGASREHCFRWVDVTFTVTNNTDSTVTFSNEDATQITLNSYGTLRTLNSAMIHRLEAGETVTKRVPVYLLKTRDYSGFFSLSQSGTDSQGKPVSFECHWP